MLRYTVDLLRSPQARDAWAHWGPLAVIACAGALIAGMAAGTALRALFP